MLAHAKKLFNQYLQSTPDWHLKRPKDAWIFITSNGCAIPRQNVTYWFNQAKANQVPEEFTPVPSVKMRPGWYIFTCAQSDTEAFLPFVQSLKKFGALVDARLVVAPFGFLTKRTDPVYDPSIAEFLVHDRFQVAPDLIFAGDVKTLPTAASPLRGFQAFTRSGSGIIPGPKLQMVSLPRMKGFPPRFLYSTGACTKPNYGESRAAKIAEFHHVYGALIVHVKEDGTWFCYQVQTEDGSWYFKGLRITADEISCAPVRGIIFGDLHAEYISDKMRKTMQDIICALEPQDIILHDILDFGPKSYHNTNNHDLLARLYFSDPDATSVHKMLNTTFEVLQELAAVGRVHVVRSNHDDHLLKWLEAQQDKTDYQNAYIWHSLNAELCYQRARGTSQPILKTALEFVAGKELSEIKFYNTDDSYRILGIEVAQHGHLGANGSPGTPAGLSAIGTKICTGHTHSAGIVDGVYTAGCMCSLDLGYNKGPSSWSHSFVVIYEDGKRSVFTIREESEW